MSNFGAPAQSLFGAPPSRGNFFGSHPYAGQAEFGTGSLFGAPAPHVRVVTTQEVAQKLEDTRREYEATKRELEHTRLLLQLASYKMELAKCKAELEKCKAELEGTKLTE